MMITKMIRTGPVAQLLARKPITTQILVSYQQSNPRPTANISLIYHRPSSSSFSSLYSTPSSSSSSPSNSDHDHPIDLQLINQLRLALKESMKARDLTRRDVIKSVIGDIQTSQHLSNPPSPSKTLKLAINKRLEAARASAESNPPRTDLEKLNLVEVSILKAFIPPEAESIPEDQLLEIVSKTVTDLSLSNQARQKAMGQVVKAVKVIVGDRADGKDIATVVKKVLGLQ